MFIELEEQNGKDALAVTNTDTAVPKEDIEHLFAPFYRADKSRNRATGGSGLGLYIVRNILDMHGMSCDIKNTQRGVCFTLLLPGAANRSDT